jgi:hypothetical protein
MIDGSHDRGVDDRTTSLKGQRSDWTMNKEDLWRSSAQNMVYGAASFLILLIATAVTMDAEVYGVSTPRAASASTYFF